MNRIILVGNGFDLAHGLPTSYKDFINWYWHNWINRLKNSKKIKEEDKLCSFQLTKYHNNWSHYFDTMINMHRGKTDYEIINDLRSNQYNSCNAVFCKFINNISLSINNKGWVDIENEYYQLLKSLLILSEKVPETLTEKAKKLNDELECLKSHLIEYLKQVQDRFLTNDKNINPEIENLIFGPINDRDMSLSAKEQIKINKGRAFIDDMYGWHPDKIMILNFNYTRTTEFNYRDKFSDIAINYIHGNLSNPESIIFGYGDELDDDFKKIRDTNDNNLLNEIKSVKYMEAANYRKLLEFIESDLFQIYIMGHSCGNSDRTLLNTLFEHKNCVTIKPFYHEREDGSDDYLNIVQNIMRNFNDMKMMRDKVVNKTFCQPLPQMKLQPNPQAIKN